MRGARRVGPDLFYDDFSRDAALPAASLRVTEDDAAFFAGRFGNGMADLGDQGSAPIACWHVAALGMRLLFDAVLVRTASLGAPGIEEVTWPYPVRVGDRLRLTGNVAAVRISTSRPEMGLVTVAICIFNQGDVCVMTQRNTIMVARETPSG